MGIPDSLKKQNKKIMKMTPFYQQPSSLRVKCKGQWVRREKEGACDSSSPFLTLVSDKTVRWAKCSLKMSWQRKTEFYFIRKGLPWKSLCLMLWKLFDVLKAFMDLGYFKAGNKKDGRKFFSEGRKSFSPSCSQNWEGGVKTEGKKCSILLNSVHS